MFTATLEGQAFSQPTGKILCIGRNYAAHAAELNNPVPDEPVLFLKPADAACDLTKALVLPVGCGSVHHELEIAILIGEPLKNAPEGDVESAIAGVGLGLDLTLRDVQSGLKEKGLPWERAKSFDGACPLSPFISAEKIADLTAINFSLTRNGQIQQQGCSGDMLNPIIPLIAHMSRWFTINSGDVIMTGTPTGVGPLEAGDQLVLELDGLLKFETGVQR